MGRGAAILTLCTALWISGAPAQNAPGDQDRDLDLIPQGAQQPSAGPSGAAPTAAPNVINTNGDSMYVENALTGASLRSQRAVSVPGAAPFRWQERLFFDIRKEWRIADPLTFTYSGRANFRAENDLSFPTHENLINDLREAYLSWQPWDHTYLDLGRINLKNGVALGYNPTDFFRTRA
ncbi:MAG TPA: hypothetical protein VI653_15565, partial [Steroidobacteraceae bacterium]